MDSPVWLIPDNTEREKNHWQSQYDDIMDGQKITVNLRIGDVKLPMAVATVEQEKLVRDAAAMLQNKLNLIRDSFPSLPSEEYYYAMASLNIAIDALNASNKASVAPVMEVLTDLEREIDEVIKK